MNWTAQQLETLYRMRVSAEYIAVDMGVPAAYAHLPRSYSLNANRIALMTANPELLVNTILHDYEGYKPQWEDSNRALSALADTLLCVECRLTWQTVYYDKFREHLLAVLNLIDGKQQFAEIVPSLLTLHAAIRGRGGETLLAHESGLAEVLLRQVLVTWYITGVEDGE